MPHYTGPINPVRIVHVIHDADVGQLSDVASDQRSTYVAAWRAAVTKASQR